MVVMNEYDENKMLNTLLSIVQDKEQKVIEFQKITKDQTQIIANGDMDRLFKTIEKRDTYIQAIDELDRKFIPLYDAIQTKYKGASPDQECIASYRELEEVLQNIHSALMEIYEEDRSNMATLKKMQAKYAGDIKRIQQGTKRQEAYSSTAPIDGGVFIDEKQ